MSDLHVQATVNEILQKPQRMPAAAQLLKVSLWLMRLNIYTYIYIKIMPVLVKIYTHMGHSYSFEHGFYKNLIPLVLYVAFGFNPMSLYRTKLDCYILGAGTGSMVAHCNPSSVTIGEAPRCDSLLLH